MDPTAHAMMMLRYREEVLQQKLPHDPDWVGVMRRAYAPALAGERGEGHQEECAIQAIQIAVWESGAIQKPWAKAFLPQVQPRIIWYRRWWDKLRAFLHDLF